MKSTATIYWGDGSKTESELTVEKIIPKFQENHSAQSKLIYSIIVAGKSANFADKATAALLEKIGEAANADWKNCLPFTLIHALTTGRIKRCCRHARTGNYEKLSRALSEAGQRIAEKKLNLWTCRPSDLEEIHGIGRKTSRFFIMWIRPHEEFAALDVHVLRWLRKNGHPTAPKATPSNPKIYEKLEIAFISAAYARGKTAREFDEEIWTAGAGRTQITPLPNENRN